VPVDLIKEVTQWTRNYRELKTPMRLINRRSLALIKESLCASQFVSKILA